MLYKVFRPLSSFLYKFLEHLASFLYQFCRLLLKFFVQQWTKTLYKTLNPTSTFLYNQRWTRSLYKIPGLCSSCVQNLEHTSSFSYNQTMKFGPSQAMTAKNGKNHSPPTPDCKWAEKTFCHIVTVVFQLTLDSSFVKVLEEGCNDVISMLTLHDQDIAAIPLTISDKHLLSIFRSFCLHLLFKGYSAHDLISVKQKS